MTLDLDAGKYAAFVWPAFAGTIVVIGWMIVDSLLRARRWREAVRRLEAAEDDGGEAGGEE